MTFSLDPQDFERLADVLRRSIGIQFNADMRPVLERRLQRVVLDGGFQSFGNFIDAIDEVEEPTLFGELVDAAVVKETYFLREEAQIQAFIDLWFARTPFSTKPRLVEPARERLLVWSAGCSTGEEVYSIAMMLAESRAIDLDNVQIWGSDLSRKSIELAKRAVYTSSAFRAVEDDTRDRYFLETPAGLKVRDRIRQPCKFAQANLLDPERPPFFAPLDVIFCRNVLIYFNAEARDQAIKIFHERLAPGGLLCLGHSESLLSKATPFFPVVTPGGILYRKPTETQRRHG